MLSKPLTNVHAPHHDPFQHDSTLPAGDAEEEEPNSSLQSRSLLDARDPYAMSCVCASAHSYAEAVVVFSGGLMRARCYGPGLVLVSFLSLLLLFPGCHGIGAMAVGRRRRQASRVTGGCGDCLLYSLPAWCTRLSLVCAGQRKTPSSTSSGSSSGSTT